jgi:sugar phosphate isomerase/epimerase
MTDMTGTTPLDRLGVCSWSLCPGDPAQLIDLLQRVGLTRIQLALGPLAYDKPWKDAGKRLEEAGITVVSGMFGTKGEDYTSLETIRRTGGVVPDETWEFNWNHILRIIPVAQMLKVGLVSFHAGFLPQEEDDPTYHKMIKRLKQTALAFASARIDLAFETGQEDAATLKRFLERLDEPNVGVNFDPANMILYGKGDPVEAVKVLSGSIRQVHVKDANPAATPGTWGDEVTVGTGSVEWPAFFEALKSGGFTGNLCIEREAGNQRVKDIVAAKELVLSLL